MRIRDFPIRRNLALLILLASGSSVLIASAGFAIYENQRYRAGALREATALANTMGANTASALAFGDQRSARELLGALATEPNVIGANLYDSRGALFATYRSPGAAADLFPSTYNGDGVRFDRRVLTLSRGVFLNHERTGSIVIVFSLGEFQTTLIEYAKIAALVLLLSVLFAWLAPMRLARLISDPLIRLSEIARHVSSEKDYSVRADISAGGETGLLIGSFNDMLSQIESREKALQAALSSLRESDERYALAARGANDGLWDWDLISNRIYFSPRWGQMLGYDESDQWSDPEEWFSRIHPADCARVRAEIAAHCEDKTSEFVSEYRMLHKSGGWIWTLSRGFAVRDLSGKAIRIAGSQTDITEGSLADPLTQIPNRLYLVDRLESAIAAADDSGSIFAVLCIDLDQFKLFNDNLGHAAGDELLIDVARRLRTSVRAAPRNEDPAAPVVARIGGDEFAILLPQIQKEEEASTVAKRVLERLREPFYFEDHRLFISASIGIAFHAAGNGPEDVLRNADTAMYAAKSGGKSRSEIFDESMLERAVTRFNTETGLHKAIDGGQLVLHYQPIVAVGDGTLHGFEALVRWNHPERGLLHPSEFVSVAEQSELIIELGDWVLREACRQTAEWQKTLTPENPLVIGVNVSFRQLNSRLVDDVQDVLQKSGIDPEHLALEMTESSIMVNAEQTLATLQSLKALKVKLEIDDFGTGYSSLSYLQKLPFDFLKIDRSFVRDLGSRDSGSLDIVKAILELARSLNLDVIAEGVETEAQARRLSELGCNYLQGFFFSKPVAADLARLWIERGSVSGVNARAHDSTAHWDSPSTLSPLGTKGFSPWRRGRN